MINPGNFMQELQKFAGSVQGDPKQQVEQLLYSGQMNQQTYNKYQQVAQAFQDGNPMKAISMIFNN